ncbi:hypothetical protein DV515_00020029 [Chloebia gouldiae]|uniref:Uncharacterized protein n=1 Tax=Chloebia gouldiae TaxID=44316 RepID=A0A3L8Q2N5_CHLGU|nr:hypothetical protein DV515_00020029 [Chloebia gouldiae]
MLPVFLGESYSCSGFLGNIAVFFCGNIGGVWGFGECLQAGFFGNIAGCFFGIGADVFGCLVCLGLQPMFF